MPAVPLIYGIAVTPKTGGEPVSEWFPTEGQRNEFLAWYKQHGRECSPVERVDQAAVDRAERLRAAEEHHRAMQVAAAGRSIISHSTRYDSSTRYDAPVYGAGGLGLGLLLGSLF